MALHHMAVGVHARVGEEGWKCKIGIAESQYAGKQRCQMESTLEALPVTATTYATRADRVYRYREIIGSVTPRSAQFSRSGRKQCITGSLPKKILGFERTGV
jgi:hypothetical protein